MYNVGEMNAAKQNEIIKSVVPRASTANEAWDLAFDAAMHATAFQAKIAYDVAQAAREAFIMCERTVGTPTKLDELGA